VSVVGESAEARAGGEVDVAWDLYGSSDEKSAAVKLKRVHLPAV
jgi:hypothetical protein